MSKSNFVMTAPVYAYLYLEHIRAGSTFFLVYFVEYIKS